MIETLALPQSAPSLIPDPEPPIRTLRELTEFELWGETYRPAAWRHRVVLVNDKPSVTLVFRGPYHREWGFFTAKGWQPWEPYFKERGCK